MIVFLGISLWLWHWYVAQSFPKYGYTNINGKLVELLLQRRIDFWSCSTARDVVLLCPMSLLNSCIPYFSISGNIFILMNSM